MVTKLWHCSDAVNESYPLNHHSCGVYCCIRHHLSYFSQAERTIREVKRSKVIKSLAHHMALILPTS
jgi:hypothetical protein